jgi:hypothetical protein
MFFLRRVDAAKRTVDSIPEWGAAIQREEELARAFQSEWVLLALAVLSLALGSVNCTAAAPADTQLSPLERVNSSFTVGDFDGDGRLDDLVVVRALRVSARRSIYNISVRMGSGVTQQVSVVGPPGGFELIQTDVTGNRTPDLVLAAPWLDRPLAVLINMDNGRGTFYLADPAFFPAANRKPSRSGLECVSTLLLHIAVISRRNSSLEKDNGPAIASPKTTVDSWPPDDDKSAGRQWVSSRASRAPPSISAES